MSELLDHLRIEKAILFAPSGGAPYALACAWKIPERLDAVGLFGAVGPNHPDAVIGALKSLRLLWRLSGYLQPLKRLQMRAFGWLAKRNPLKLANFIRNAELSESDKLVFDTPEIQQLLERDFPEAYRQNGIGSAYDASVPGSWPIPLEEIQSRICIWHAQCDQLVGTMPVYIHGCLKNSELEIIPDQGHLWVLNNVSNMLSHLIEVSGSNHEPINERPRNGTSAVAV